MKKVESRTGFASFAWSEQPPLKIPQGLVILEPYCSFASTPARNSKCRSSLQQQQQTTTTSTKVSDDKGKSDQTSKKVIRLDLFPKYEQKFTLSWSLQCLDSQINWDVFEQNIVRREILMNWSLFSETASCVKGTL